MSNPVGPVKGPKGNLSKVPMPYVEGYKPDQSSTHPNKEITQRQNPVTEALVNGTLPGFPRPPVTSRAAARCTDGTAVKNWALSHL